MKSITKHISCVILLLFVAALGSRALSAYEAWCCASSSTQSAHHECCSCHCTSYGFHTQSFAERCESHSMDSQSEATIFMDSKQTFSKRVFVLISAICLLTLAMARYTTSSRDYGEQRRVDYVKEWICSVGLLRAPPIC